MRKILFNGAIIFFVLQPWGLAQSIVWPVDPEQSFITFMGKSTFHDFEGNVGKIRGQLVFNDSKPVAHGQVEVDTLSLQTGEPARDKEMYIMFNARMFPMVNFDIQRADFSPAGQYDVIMQGILHLHGISRPFNIPAKVSLIKKEYVCQGAFSVSLKEFGLKPPNVLGIIKVADRVMVQFHVAFHNDL